MNQTQTYEYSIRKGRSAVACTSCRRRKIRCDVTFHGSPCTNCRLDLAQCLIIPARRQRKIAAPGVAPEIPRVPQHSRQQNSPTSIPVPAHYREATPESEPVGECASGLQWNGPDQNFYPSCLSTEMRWLARHEVEYLKSRKALTLPKSSTVRTLLQFYFLHVHPCFPVVKESEFRASTRNQKPFSMLVFRSMLFAAACHVTSECAEDAGYTSVAHMLYSLDKKAKSLYDFGVEKDSFHIAQSALLLTYHYDFTDPMRNTTWLAIAIQHAQRANANQHQVLLAPANYRPSDLKRLWWCCILRDRVLALAVRRPLVITPDQFVTTSKNFLSMDDVWDKDSDFFDVTERTVLYQVLINQCQLASILTPLGVLADPSPSLTDPNVCIEREKDSVKQLYSKLSLWHEYHETLLGNRQANRNLAVAVNIHLTSLLYIAAHLAVWQRLAVLYLYECHCTPKEDHREQYVSGLAKIVSTANKEIEWFAINQALSRLPVNIRCFTLLPHTLNLLWLDGDDITQPGNPLKYYTELDKGWSTRNETLAVTQYIRQVLGIIVAAYDASANTPGYLAQPAGTLGLGASSSSLEKRHRLANICLRVSLLLDYMLATGDCDCPGSTSIASLLIRLDTRQPTFNCLSSTWTSFSSSSPTSFPGQSGGQYSNSPQSASSLSSASDYGGESQQLQLFGQTFPSPLHQQKALPAPPARFPTMASSGRDDYDGGGDIRPSEKVTAVAHPSKHSMQNWVGELDELLVVFGC
ncbi:hypothetical protein BDW59DRAFT_150936 [Aspergillus cavernicola]|uniref:Zn(2)-C6 fungal-type domain-containing protein n=1 Tax=Aspergillus cavernicola TaxID=176166 RepID=A0ABR4HXY7_9EURO